MVVKYITMSFASHWLIVSQVMVSSCMLIHSAVMLAVALMSSSIFKESMDEVIGAYHHDVHFKAVF